MTRPEELMNVEAVARELGLSPAAVNLAIRRGVLPAVPIDRRTRLVRRADLETYRQEHLRKRGPRPKGRG